MTRCLCWVRTRQPQVWEYDEVTFIAAQVSSRALAAALDRDDAQGAALEHLAAAALVLGRCHGLEHTSWWARINMLTCGRLLTMAPAG